MSKSISTKSLTPQEYLTQGNQFYSSGRYTDPLGAYDRAISLNPDDADAYLNKGNTLKALNRLDQALSCYDKAIFSQSDI